MSVGFTTFFPKQCPTVFRVMNIAPNNKRIKIFNLPIPAGSIRDLMAQPEVSEADIRHALLKGELLRKIQAGEIYIVESNIDLMQFDSCQKAFLQSAGITVGLEPLSSGPPAIISYSFRVGEVLVGATDGVNRIFTIPNGEKFINGLFNGNHFEISITHNGRDLLQGIDYITFESGGVGTGYDSIQTTSFIPDVTSNLWAEYVVAT